MYQFFVQPEQIEGNQIYITGKDVNHIKNVLRMKQGEELNISNGIDGKEYRCGILRMESERIVCELRFIKEDKLELPVQIYLFQGLPKADKMELVIQKAVELGVYEIIPVASKRAVVKLDEKKQSNKLLRWNSIAEAAAKQSKRGIIPEVTKVMSFKEAVDFAAEMEVGIIPYELAQDMNKTREMIGQIKKGQKIAVFIGPEGGFSEDEIAYALERKIEPITLGKRILRTETAGFTVLAFILYQMEE